MTEIDLRKVATALQRVALEAVEPQAAIRRHVTREGEHLIVAGRRYLLTTYERVFILAFGKAAYPMTAATAELLGDRLTAGVAITKHGHLPPKDRMPALPIQFFTAGHPVPDENSQRGAQAVLDLAQQATERDLVICLISGGGSALLTYPVPALGLDGLRLLTDKLLRSGATIGEMNAVRKHCSLVKGGQLAQVIAPATLVTLVLSDVIGDPLDVIASGPTVPDSTTVADAQAVLRRYQIDETVPFHETPKQGDLLFEKGQHVIIGSNRLAAMAALEEARRLGFNSLLLGTYVEGEAREVGRVAASFAKSIREHGDPLPPPACLIWGGETTVTVRGSGMGGRNQELALAAAIALDGWRDVLLMALATDGTDGPTDGAGAVITGETVSRARALGLDPLAYLEENDSYHFFSASGELLRIGPTGTNVNDLLFLLVG